ncbi:helix-turn-helix domain-containing protein [bacterium]|nr:helix-turn-helix domain-containing protein [bacterium]MBQ9149682.1 helix-turn-helix domain-containing protein [bacterium]
MIKQEYVSINEIARIKGLKSNRSLRIAIQKGKYIAREISVKGGKSYEILYSSLESEVQELLENEAIKSTAIVSIDEKQKINFLSESAKLTALARVDILNLLSTYRTKYKTKQEADAIFLELYNSGLLLPHIYKLINEISRSTLRRWLKDYETYGLKGLYPQYKYTKQGEYNTSLDPEMKKIFLNYLLNPNKFSIGKAAKLTRHILL